MNLRFSNRRGSALLIVLGMLSFMVISAVAFSVFMRQSRVPSSFVRQKAVSAQLVKAGLAQAMRRIDEAIGENPYPGIGIAGNKNYWFERVLFEDLGIVNKANESQDEDEPADTISTLTLEALAYLPPPLINTVRYLSRVTPTAEWESLDYDAGRYAFTAVNVSDYFDINRVHAGVMRDSSPSNRISMAYLFETGDHTGFATDPKKFDDFMTKTRTDGYRTRLVSLADYNLAVGTDDGKSQYGNLGFTSPFVEYIKGNFTDGFVYKNENDAKFQKFVTDSWFPGCLTNTTSTVLTEVSTLPVEGAISGIDDLMKSGSGGWNKIKPHLNLPEHVAYWDYLDNDSIPLSLAMPTLERTPMLTGLRFAPQASGFAPVIERTKDKVEQPQVGEGQPKKTITYKLWKLSGFDDPKIMVSINAAYPFKRKSGIVTKTSYDVDVLVRAYLVESSTTMENTRVDDGRSYRPTTRDEWKSDFLLGGPDKGCLSLYGKSTVTVAPCVDEEEALVRVPPFTLTCDGKAAGDGFALYGLKVTEEEGKEPVIEFDTSRFGEVNGGKPFYYLKDGKLEAASGADDRIYKWQFFAWVRILDGNNVVDMFPATLADDALYNGFAKPQMADLTMFGEPSKEAVVPIAGPTVLELTKKKFKDAKEGPSVEMGESEPLSICCCDPRFNWAPEDWFSIAGGNDIMPTAWYDSYVKGLLNGNDDRPKDLFQFVSDEGYLQSMGEIYMLPLVRTDYNDLDPTSARLCDFIENPDSRYTGKPFKDRTAANKLANHVFMWKTRCPWDDSIPEAHNPYKWDMIDTRGGTVINPYSSSEMYMAALANTPYDWIVAAEKEENELTDENLKLCFNARSDEAKVTWEQLEKLATNLRAEIINYNGASWQDNYRRAAGWDSDNFFNSDIDNLHEVDRKFLYAYWRNCFGNDQQLFLVFVRAEPTVMGSSSAGHTPAQLGARAVALVWREPVSSIKDSSNNGAGAASRPHRMRILFYHQFD